MRHRFHSSWNARISLAVLSLSCVLGGAYFWLTVNPLARGILWSPFPVFLYPALQATAAVVLVVLLAQKLRGRWLFDWCADALAVVACALLACYHVSPGWMSVYATTHLEPILFPVTQVLQGRTILVDTQSVYGLFPHFLEPIFRVVPLSMTSFSCVMASLLFGTLFCAYRFLRLTTPSPLIAWIGFLGYLFGPFTTLNAGFPHYQCYPLRTFFPALLLWLGARYLKRPERTRFVVLSVASGLALMWNLDSGIACVGGALALVVGRVMVQRESWRARTLTALREAAAFAVVAGGIVVVVLASLWLRSGEAPQVGELFAFQKIFYAAGFLMEPMDPYGAWWLIVVVYLAAMAAGLAAFFHEGSKRRAPVYLMLAVLGAGVFAYYQGRSVLPNLYYVAWPSLLVLGVFLGDLARGSRAWSWRGRSWLVWSANVWQGGQLAVVTFAICLLVITMVQCLERIGTTYTLAEYQSTYAEYKSDWYDRVRPVQDCLQEEEPDTPVLVLSARDHLWHLFLRRPSVLQNAGFNHMFRQSEIDELCRLLEEGRAPAVVWDETYLQTPMPEIAYGYVSNAEKVRLLDVLKRRYRLAAISASRGDLPFSIWVPADGSASVAEGAKRARTR